MTPFRERNPVPIGAIGLAVIGLLLLAAFNADRLPIIGGGTVYAANFTEAGGLKPQDEVRVAGVKVGKVESVSLDGDHVRVRFRVKGARLGSRTKAAIQIKTVLGQKYLGLTPEGNGRLDPDRAIPLSRTTAPFDVVPAFSQLSETVEDIDTDQLAQSFDTLASTFRDTPPEVRSSLRGLSRLSRTIASRDEQLASLLEHSRGVTKVLADRNQEFTKLLADGDLLLQEVQRRREVIHALLVNTSTLSEQLTGLVRDNRAQLAPSLSRLRQVVAILQRNEANLDKSVELLAPFVRLFANTVGNGRWFDTYVSNLIPGPVPGTVRSGR